MYNLGEQFRIDYEKAISDQNGIIKGKKYRITILTERLVRFEYSESGKFEDRPTELVLNRSFKTPKFEIKQDDMFIELATPYLKFSYVKEKKLETDRMWYYGHPEAKKYNGPFTILANKNNNNPLSRNGLYSIDGFATIDDSTTKVFESTGNLIERENKEIDIYLFAYGHDYEKALQDYFVLTGYPPLIPRYALGNWWNKNVSYTDLSLKELLETFEVEE